MAFFRKAATEVGGDRSPKAAGDFPAALELGSFPVSGLLPVAGFARGGGPGAQVGDSCGNGDGGAQEVAGADDSDGASGPFSEWLLVERPAVLGASPQRDTPAFTFSPFRVIVEETRKLLRKIQKAALLLFLGQQQADAEGDCLVLLCVRVSGPCPGGLASSPAQPLDLPC